MPLRHLLLNMLSEQTSLKVKAQSNSRRCYRWYIPDKIERLFALVIEGGKSAKQPSSTKNDVILVTLQSLDMEITVKLSDFPF